MQSYTKHNQSQNNNPLIAILKNDAPVQILESMESRAFKSGHLQPTLNL